MSKAGQRLLNSVRRARAYARGETADGFVVHVPDSVDVKAVRKKLAMTQRQFATQFGFGYDAVRDWESRRRQPERAARILLTVIGYEPKLVVEALLAQQRGHDVVERTASHETAREAVRLRARRPAHGSKNDRRASAGQRES